jgi:hypothetical protein
MPLRPAEIHAQEHLRPVGRLRAAGAGADRQQRAAFVVLAREEELGALPLEVLFECCRLAVELRGQLGIGRFLDELQGGQQVLGPAVETTPQLDLRSETIGVTKDPLGCPLVVPEAGGARLRLQLGDPLLLGV